MTGLHLVRAEIETPFVALLAGPSVGAAEYLVSEPFEQRLLGHVLVV